MRSPRGKYVLTVSTQSFNFERKLLDLENTRTGHEQTTQKQDHITTSKLDVKSLLKLPASVRMDDLQPKLARACWAQTPLTFFGLQSSSVLAKLTLSLCVMNYP